jgi:hypothetical protein
VSLPYRCIRAFITSDDGTELAVNGRPMIDTTPISLELNEALDQVEEGVLHKWPTPAGMSLYTQSFGSRRGCATDNSRSRPTSEQALTPPHSSHAL